MYTFTIDDTTGKLSVVYFARDTKVNALDLSLRDEKNVVISGKLSDRNGSKQIMVDKMWLADVDYSTIKTELPQKSANKIIISCVPKSILKSRKAVWTIFLAAKRKSRLT